MYVISKELLSYWNKNKISLYIKRQFLKSLGLNPGDYKNDFTTNCAFIWIRRGSSCIIENWETFEKHTADDPIMFIFYNDFRYWQSNRYKKEEPIKEDKNVNRLQKQKTQIDRGDFPEGNRIKGRTCKVTIGVGHLSYQAVKS